jgi:hypothetical protein
MSSTFRYHSQVNEIVPANATYTFPTQSTKVNKQVTKVTFEFRLTSKIDCQIGT